MSGDQAGAGDLRYVRGIVERADRVRPARGVFLIWAVFIPAGFALADLAPDLVGCFWLVATPHCSPPGGA